MSAFMVTDATIDTIVAAAHKYRLIRKSSADVIGQAIKAQNQYALSVRYALEDAPNWLDFHATGEDTYSYTEFPRLLKRDAIDGAIRCWQYQCAEFVGVQDTAISRLVEQVRERNANRILDRDPDYDFNATPPVWDVADRDDVMVAPRPEPVLEPVEDEDDDGSEEDLAIETPDLGSDTRDDWAVE